MTKLINMTADTAPDRASYVYVVDSPGGTPADTYSTLANAVKNGITRYVTITIFDKDTFPSTGDGKNYISIPPDVDDMHLTYAFASYMTPHSGGSPSGATTIQIANVTTGQDMLSGLLTIDNTETNSSTGSYTINATYQHVDTNNQLRVDVDTVQTGGTTAALGLYITLGFAWPS